MKKTVSIVLSLIIMLCAAIPVFAASDAEEKVNGDSSLIMHYDFENTGKGPAYDKSVGGKSVEYIDHKHFDEFKNVTLENGTMRVTGTKGAVTYLSGMDSAKKGEDFNANPTGELAFYTSFKVSNLDKAAGSLSQGRNDIFRLYRKNADKSLTDVFRVYVTQDAQPGKPGDGMSQMLMVGPDGAYKGTTYKFDINRDTFMQVYTTMKFDNGTWTYKIFVCDDNTNTFNRVLITTYKGYTEDFYKKSGAKGENLYLAYGNTTENCTGEFVYDDCRVYNKVLMDKNSVLTHDFSLDIKDAGVMYHGVQSTLANAETNKYSVRFVGSIDSLNYSAVGFKVCTKDANNKNFGAKQATTVYKKLTGITEIGLALDYTAKELRGNDTSYLYALTINNIPADLDVTFVVTPYYVKDGKTVESTPYAVTYVKGVYQSTAVYSGK